VHFAGRTTGLDRRATNEWPPPLDEGVMKIAGGLNQEFSLIRGLFPIIPPEPPAALYKGVSTN
jgi:hypothetical protein